jgi:CubicO group peptidase (beta-lactamase class C family)
MSQRRLIVALGVVLAVHFTLELTNHRYIYNVLNLTVFKGKLGPSIDEFPAFANDTIQAGAHQIWNLSRNYNKRVLPQKYLDEHERLGSVAYLVIHRDSILHEQYWDEYGPDSHSNSFSMAKSIVSALIGVAITEGHIKSVQDPVCNYLPEYCEGLGSELTIEDLLTMSAGINFDEHYMNPFAFPAKANYGRDLRELISEYEVVDTPGKVYSYQSGVTQILGFVVEAATGETLAHYAQEKLWKPMGARNYALWSLDHENGEAKAFCCFNSNARDFARFGKLYHQNGNWNGKQLIDSAFVANSIIPAEHLVETNGEVNERYGYQWWTAPSYNNKYDVFYMRGILGQYVFVVPEEDLIIVRLGHKRDKAGEFELPKDVYFWIDGGLEIAGISPK